MNNNNTKEPTKCNVCGSKSYIDVIKSRIESFVFEKE